MGSGASPAPVSIAAPFARLIAGRFVPVVELPGIAPGLPRCERGVILVDYSPRLEPLTGFEPILVLYESTVPPSTLERHVVALAGFEPATCSL